jgi:hypothetical protein
MLRGKGGGADWLGGAGIGGEARRRGGGAGAIERGDEGVAATGDCDAAARGGDEEGRGGAGRPGALPLVAAEDGASDPIERRSLVFEGITADWSLASADTIVAAAIAFSLLTLAIMEDVPFLFADWRGRAVAAMSTWALAKREQDRDQIGHWLAFQLRHKNIHPGASHG